MLIFGNMARDDGKKLAIVLECLEIDNPRSPKDYIVNLMTWETDELIVYREKRKSEHASTGYSRFRPHP